MRARACIARAGLIQDTRFTVTDPAELLRRIAEAGAQGYSINWEEHTLGVGSVAAPINTADGRFLCVLSIGFATSQVERDDLGALGAEIKTAARRLAADRFGRHCSEAA